MSDRINHADSSNSEMNAHPNLVAEALNFPTTTIQIKQDYPTCHSTPHHGDAPGGDIKLGGDGGNADAKAAASAKAAAEALSNSQSSARIGDVKSTSQGGNANSSARSGDATARTGDVTVNNNGNDGSRRVPDVTVVPASVPKTDGGSGFSITKQRGSNVDQISAHDLAVGRSNSAGGSLGLPGLGIGFTAADGGPTAESEARMQETHEAGKYLVGGTAASMIFDNDPEIKKVSRDGYLETLKKKPESK